MLRGFTGNWPCQSFAENPEILPQVSHFPPQYGLLLYDANASATERVDSSPSQDGEIEDTQTVSVICATTAGKRRTTVFVVADQAFIISDLAASLCGCISVIPAHFPC